MRVEEKSRLTLLNLEFWYGTGITFDFQYLNFRIKNGLTLALVGTFAFALAFDFSLFLLLLQLFPWFMKFFLAGFFYLVQYLWLWLVIVIIDSIWVRLIGRRNSRNWLLSIKLSLSVSGRINFNRISVHGSDEEETKEC